MGYNPPDGLDISFDIDGAYIEVSNGEIVDIMSHRDVKLKEPSEVEQQPDAQVNSKYGGNSQPLSIEVVE